MGQKGREYIQNNFSYDKIAKQFINLNSTKRKGY